MKNTRKFIQGTRYASIAVATKIISFVNKDEANRYLLARLENLPGIPAKIGQLLQRKWNVSYSPALKQPLLDISQIKAIIASESATLNDLISEIDEKGESASIGQVHRAWLKSGQEVAIKVQYPGISEVMESQCDLLLGLADQSPASKYGWDNSTYGNYLREQLERETNYIREAQNQLRFYDFLKNQSEFIVPRVYPEFSTRKILVQDWQNGTHLESLLSLTKEEKADVVTKLLKFNFLTLFNMHSFHSDFQPMNWAYSSIEKKLTVYDYGSIGQLAPHHAERLAEAIFLSHENKHFSGKDFLIGLGFDEGRLKPIEPKLDELVFVLLEPFRSDTPVPIKSWNLAEQIDRLLGSDKWWFRTSGPLWFFSLIRNMEGLSYALERLGEPVPLWKVFSQVTKRPFQNVISLDIGKSSTSHENPASLLYVLVEEGNETIVEMEMPARAVDDLDSLIPEEVKEKLTGKVDIKSVIARAKDTRYQPQTLFEASSDKRRYRVLLK